MTLTKTPICNFGEKAKDFNLKSIESKRLSLKDVSGENGTLVMKLSVISLSTKFSLSF